MKNTNLSGVSFCKAHGQLGHGGENINFTSILYTFEWLESVFAMYEVI